MKKKIPFKPRFKEPMLSGVKTWTSRTKRYGKDGDTFEAFGHEFEIIESFKLQLGDVCGFFREEGFKSEEEFVEFWEKIHPRKGYRINQWVFVHVFRRIS